MRALFNTEGARVLMECCSVKVQKTIDKETGKLPSETSLFLKCVNGDTYAIRMDRSEAEEKQKDMFEHGIAVLTQYPYAVKIT